MLTLGGQFGYIPALVGATTTTTSDPIFVTDHYEGAKTLVGVQVEGISGDTVEIEGTIDGSTWYSLEVTNYSDSTDVDDAITADGIYHAVVLGLFQVRVALTRVGGTVSVSVLVAA